ncbi:HAD family hydrolase [Streptomyces sp. NPDC127098]|uniref:HAD family hydrolase n=1 Tax=Streptomyces sp. NPDC127098 TaxID=3347137 RepID=UPI00365EA073
MPFLMLDLDNTLIDRDAAFRSAAAEFLTQHGLPSDELAWLLATDASGYAPRADVASAMSGRYRDHAPAGAVHALLDTGDADHVTLAQSTASALHEARAAGWTCVIVTNGRTAQQEAKIRNTGLDRLVHGWVVSEAIGHKKPAPEILQAAATLAGLPLTDAWLVGDSPHADIAGAHALGLRSVWVSRPDAPWPYGSYGPTHRAADAASAIAHVIGANRS